MLCCRAKLKNVAALETASPLQAMGSFIKDLFLLLLIIILFFYRKEIVPSFTARASQLILALTVVLSFYIQWYVLRYLPLIDCLPFKKGANIFEKMKAPAGAIQDSTVMNFVYEKNKQTLEFTADKFPADFDSSYTFVKRYDKLDRKGNAEPEIKDFSLFSESGTDTTMQVLSKPGYQLMLISRSFEKSNPNWNKYFILLYSLAKSKGIPVYIVTSNRTEAMIYVTDNALSQLPVYGCDATAVKTAARADPTLYLLKKGTILNKWSYANLELAVPLLAELPVQPSQITTP